MSEAEQYIQYIDEQVASQLRPGEQIEQRGYLETVMSGSVLSALGAKGYWLALTDQRLLLIQTKVGAFKPVMANKGIESIELEDLSAVHVRGNQVTIVPTEGKPRLLVAKHHKRVPGQDDLLAALHQRWGEGELAPPARFAWVKKLAIALVVVAIGVAIGIYRSRSNRIEVYVECKSGPSRVTCTLEHRKGSARAKACFSVVFTCKNGKRPAVHKCGVVAAGGESAVEIPYAQFSGGNECDEATGLDVTNLKVTEP